MLNVILCYVDEFTKYICDLRRIIRLDRRPLLSSTDSVPEQINMRRKVTREFVDFSVWNTRFDIR